MDGCGLSPLAAAERDYPTAHAFRRHLQKTLPVHLAALPAADPLDGADLPGPPAPAEALAARPEFLAGLGLAGDVPPAARHLARFLWPTAWSATIWTTPSRGRAAPAG